MPKMNGAELIEKGRKINPNLRFLVMSGKPNSDLAQKAKDLSGYDIIVKPVNDHVNFVRDIERIIYE